MGWTEVVVCHWGGVGLAVEVECANVPRHEGRWDCGSRVECWCALLATVLSREGGNSREP